MNIVDASGWIEFFLAGRNGPVFRPIIEDEANLLVTSISVYEVHRVLSRKLPEELRDTCVMLMRRLPIIDLTDARAIAAANVSIEYKLAMADAAMYAMAMEHQAVLWTQDADYQGLSGVQYVAKH
jgi:predicted nucleic acid-binding protein